MTGLRWYLSAPNATGLRVNGTILAKTARTKAGKDGLRGDMAFVVIGAPRTGSTHFIIALSGHPQILCNPNVFKAKHVQLSWPKVDKTPKVLKDLAALREANPLAFIDRMFAASYGRPHVGFKIFQGQHDQILDHMIKDPVIKKIVLYRKNVLATYSSTRLAISSGKYRGRKSHEKVPSARTKFQEKRFLSFHNEHVSFYRSAIERLRACSQSFHIVSYDDLNSMEMMSEVIAFIGADPSLPIAEQNYTNVRKQNTSYIVSRFSNEEDVEVFWPNMTFSIGAMKARHHYPLWRRNSMLGR